MIYGVYREFIAWSKVTLVRLSLIAWKIHIQTPQQSAWGLILTVPLAISQTLPSTLPTSLSIQLAVPHSSGHPSSCWQSALAESTDTKPFHTTHTLFLSKRCRWLWELFLSCWYAWYLKRFGVCIPVRTAWWEWLLLSFLICSKLCWVEGFISEVQAVFLFVRAEQRMCSSSYEFFCLSNVRSGRECAIWGRFWLGCRPIPAYLNF